ncbi:hypothetical protein BKI52_21300 [marine bacterium AO1-C]|nr:hypothetical protein BKI52_21300 [marine bacterium AO1-C]
MPNKFFTKINYSASNEDSESERKALQLTPQDVVLCITGSGARPLDLLVDAPQKIISIDFNPSQNHLLALKIAAYRHLDYQAFAEFIGLYPSNSRLVTYQKLQTSLPPKAQDFWNGHPRLISGGILYCGTWERLLRGMLKMAKPRKKTLQQLINAPSLEAQKDIWTKKWDNWLWRGYLKLISNQFLWKHIVREPGAKLIPKTFDVYAYMKQRLDHMAMNFDLKTNHYAQLIFQGGYQPNCALPHHLRPENYTLIQNKLENIEVITNTLSSYLDTASQPITAFSLSDFASYAPLDVYQATWQKIIQAAAPQARFCERHYLVKRNPEKQFPAIQRNQALEETLTQTDETYIYSFCAGHIAKN